MTNKKIKLTIYLTEDLDRLLEEETKRLGSTKTQFVTSMLRTQLDFQKRVIEQITPEVLNQLIDNLKFAKIKESTEDETDQGLGLDLGFDITEPR